MMDGRLDGPIDGLEVYIILEVKSALGPLPDSSPGWPRHPADKVGSATQMEC